jgi:hypothetical protein
LLVLLVAAGVLTWWLRRSGRTRHGFAALFCSLASVCLIVAVTLLRDGWPRHFSLGGLAHWSSAGYDRLSSDPFGSSQFVLNIALFVPAGAAWTWMTRRPGAVAAGLVGGSLLVESVQALTGLGAPDVADLVANSIGALVGVGAAALVSRARGHRARLMLSPRRRAIAVVAVLAFGAAAVTLLFVGADRRQRSVERELRAAFAGTTKTDIDRWNVNNTMLDQVFNAVSVFADGTQYSPGEVKVRYPASFFGMHRCVFVVWTPTSVRFEHRSGDACTEFIG